jgi:antitoxin component YwqK of YwqJK toxin-antitoxin module
VLKEILGSFIDSVTQ